LLDDLTVQNVAVLLTLQVFVPAFSLLLLTLDLQALGLHSACFLPFHGVHLLLHVVLSNLGGKDILVVVFQV
jgi:hypothetical protein